VDFEGSAADASSQFSRLVFDKAQALAVPHASRKEDSTFMSLSDAEAELSLRRTEINQL